MKFRGLMIGLVCVVLPVAAWAGSKEDAKNQFTQANELLKKGDIEGAAKAFEAAAKGEPENQNYQIKSMLVQRILSMRQTLDQQTDDVKWLNTAKALHTFYDENGIHDQALGLATKAHSRLNTTETAVMLARSRLALGMNSEAAEGLRGITTAKVNAEVRTLLGIALARQGNKEEAKKLLKSLKDAPTDNAQYDFDLARLNSLLGNEKDGLKSLVRSFENTPSAELDGAKDRARASEDLKALRDKAGYKKALETQSKVVQSKCSQGTDCGKCPMRKQCQGGEKNGGGDKDGGGAAPTKP